MCEEAGAKNQKRKKKENKNDGKAMASGQCLNIKAKSLPNLR